jgi:hypothetical protein
VGELLAKFDVKRAGHNERNAGDYNNDGIYKSSINEVPTGLMKGTCRPVRP